MARLGARASLVRRMQWAFFLLVVLALTGPIMAWLIERDYARAVFGTGNAHISEIVLIGRLDVQGRRVAEYIKQLQDAEDVAAVAQMHKKIGVAREDLLGIVDGLAQIENLEVGGVRKTMIDLRDQVDQYAVLMDRMSALEQRIGDGLRDTDKLVVAITEFSQDIARGVGLEAGIRLARLEAGISRLYATIFLLREPVGDAQAHEARERFIGLANEVRKLAKGSVEEDLSKSIEDLLLASTGPGGLLDQLKRRFATLTSLKEARARLGGASEELLRHMSRLAEQTPGRLQDSAAGLRRDIISSYRVMMGGAFLVIFSVIWVGWREIGKRFGARLTLLTNSAERAVEGSEEHFLDMSGNDELARLARAFDTLRARAGRRISAPRKGGRRIKGGHTNGD